MAEDVNASLMRSRETIKAVRFEKLLDGSTIKIVADLPVGRGYMQGNGFIDYKNMGIGWIPYSEHEANEHQKEVEAKKVAEAKAAEEAKKAEEAKPKVEKEKK